MREFALYLRKVREDKGLSLQQINDATKIRLCYLEAIESGDFDAIPGPVYLRGFLRSYAACVGLNPAEVLAQFDAARAAQTPPESSGYSRPVKSPRAKSPLPPLTGRKWGYFAIGAVLLLSVAVGLFWLFSRSRIPGSSAVQVESQAVEPTGRNNGITSVALEVVAACWTEASVDGKLVFSGTLSPGDTPSWTGKEVDIVLGNAAGVILTVNGRRHETTGEVGERVELKFGNDSP